MATKANRICPVAQRTLQNAVTASGIGVHSGGRIALTLQPAPVNSGIVFVRTDVAAATAAVPALWDKVTFTRLCTVISNDHGVSVATIEHLLAALRGCGIDNVRIEIDGPEVPIMDGSAAPWVALIRQAGSVCQAARRRVIRVHKPVQVRDGDKYALLLPADSARFTVEIDFPNPVVGFQKYDIELTDGSFQRDIAAARTFGFLPEIEALRRQGLARGGSTDNAIVIDGERVLNPEGLRYADEFVRHKILDCIGDLYLAGAPILGHVVGRKVGHQLNNELLRALFAESGAWSYATYDTADEVPAGIGGELLAA